MPQIHIALTDDPTSGKVADVEVHFTADESPDREPKLAGISIWTTDGNETVVFPTMNLTGSSTVNSAAIQGLEADILSAYHAEKRESAK